MVVLVARPVAYVAHTAWIDAVPVPRAQTAGFASDAGATPIAIQAQRIVPADDAAALTLLRASFAEARAGGIHVAFAGARHSMGGQTAARDGIVLDMSRYTGVRYDAGTDTVTVRAGTTWSQVLRALEPVGRSVAVMQSNNVFTVGGSLSVNAHGWQPLSSPIAGSVVSLRVLLADGSEHVVSREREPELFALILGGYGLFGAVLEAELRVVPNARYRLQRIAVPVQDYVAAFEREITGRPGESGLAYGRIGVAPSVFLQQSVLTVFRPEPGPIPPLDVERHPSRLARWIFRGQAGSDYGKELRWSAERNFGDQLLRPTGSRNQILDEDISGFANSGAGSIDLLQEYFVPRAALPAFVETVRGIVAGSGTDLLNITVRDVAADTTTVLRYADRDMFCLVLLFHVTDDPAAEARLQRVGERLVDAALDAGGRYYLPYRLYARPDQFERAYPQAAQFFAAKRRYDPAGVFSNELHRRYASAR
ncbi:FAD-binding oxidoreductase [Tahibacter sp. UC22_41]|uniref:FAD-binding oxidoreductase n=1 Tax=Tahibacter sp. UC22_41 TaxID=3350178 RepID=UPI0036DB9119